jgi:hypothetical protein
MFICNFLAAGHYFSTNGVQFLCYKEKLIANVLVGNTPGLIYAHNQEFSGGKRIISEICTIHGVQNNKRTMYITNTMQLNTIKQIKEING